MRIDAVLFDMGGTIEDVRYDDAQRLGATRELRSFLAGEGIVLGADDAEVLAAIQRGLAGYRSWSERTMREAPAAKVWREWYLREYGLPKADADRLAGSLAVLWETRFHVRSIRPEAAATLVALKQRGFRLGVISNTSSEEQVLGSLEQYGIRGFFECVCLSCVSGIRKPDPRIFLDALARLGIPPERAAYVGDTVSRDISGSKAAGYALAIQIRSFMTASRDSALPPGCAVPDYVVEDLGEVVTVLDAIASRKALIEEA